MARCTSERRKLYGAGQRKKISLELIDIQFIYPCILIVDIGPGLTIHG
jgi:hypothetical protein